MSPSAANTPSYDDFAQALEAQSLDSQKGQLVRGKVYEYSTDGAYIDIGGKAPAFLPKREAALHAVLDLEAHLPKDEELEFLVIRDQNEDGQVTVSLRALALQQAWTRVAELQESGQTVQVKVTGSNKGGVTADLEGLRAFIPRSHLNEKEDLDGLKGKILTVAFLEVNRADKKLVLSERQAARTALVREIEVGQLVSGKVTGLKPFGVFVDLGGATALLPINQISQRFVSDVGTIFKVGDPIQALVVAIDNTKGRISLSTKVLENHPGEILENVAELQASAADRAERARKQLESQ
ncbi:S1 RNA-binding domain-containing protein [Synechococcus elongatus]|uniref:S1 RNA-binding domain-containing protein n=2 Tax=Synechococcus elongatus TaxID=32046 RepID=A0AAN1QNS2_SYNEL|nr:S1 RNA-binding domain-containing protein [Synechococcus elongatus]AZB72783.1 30S ribosomal protein S1 [Synechococcus elongatus PCC 11801]QFZ92576.1 S1 RNA-binding domain-containing protein [Synechococcus elongatus PCC 11802]